MTKLTDDQIESTLTQGHANIVAVQCVTHDNRVIDPAIRRELRAAFTAGRDHGEACVLERAESLLVGATASAQAQQALDSAAALVAWVEAEDPFLEMRSYTVRHTTFLDPEKRWAATAHALNSSHLVYGASHAEALSKLATWCADHMKRDTVPAPAPSPSDSVIKAAPEAT